MNTNLLLRNLSSECNKHPYCVKPPTKYILKTMTLKATPTQS